MAESPSTTESVTNRIDLTGRDVIAEAFDLDALAQELHDLGCFWEADWDGNDCQFLHVGRGGLRLIAYPFAEVYVHGSHVQWSDIPVLLAVARHAAPTTPSDPEAAIEPYHVVDCGWSEFDNAPRFEVRCTETGEVIYIAEDEATAEVMCARYTADAATNGGE